MKHLLEIQNIS